MKLLEVSSLLTVLVVVHVQANPARIDPDDFDYGDDRDAADSPDFSYARIVKRDTGEKSNVFGNIAKFREAGVHHKRGNHNTEHQTSNGVNNVSETTHTKDKLPFNIPAAPVEDVKLAVEDFSQKAAAPAEGMKLAVEEFRELSERAEPVESMKLAVQEFSERAEPVESMKLAVQEFSERAEPVESMKLAVEEFKELSERAEPVESMKLAVEEFRELSERAEPVESMKLAVQEFSERAEPVESMKLAVEEFKELSERAEPVESMKLAVEEFRELSERAEPVEGMKLAVEEFRELSERAEPVEGMAAEAEEFSERAEEPVESVKLAVEEFERAGDAFGETAQIAESQAADAQDFGKEVETELSEASDVASEVASSASQPIQIAQETLSEGSSIADTFQAPSEIAQEAISQGSGIAGQKWADTAESEVSNVASTFSESESPFSSAQDSAKKLSELFFGFPAGASQVISSSSSSYSSSNQDDVPSFFHPFKSMASGASKGAHAAAETFPADKADHFFFARSSLTKEGIQPDQFSEALEDLMSKSASTQYACSVVEKPAMRSPDDGSEEDDGNDGNSERQENNGNHGIIGNHGSNAKHTNNGDHGGRRRRSPEKESKDVTDTEKGEGFWSRLFPGRKRRSVDENSVLADDTLDVEKIFDRIKREFKIEDEYSDTDHVYYPGLDDFAVAAAAVPSANEKRSILEVATDIVRKIGAMQKGIGPVLLRLVHEDTVGEKALPICSIVRARQTIQNGLTNFIYYLPQFISLDADNLQESERQNLLQAFDNLSEMLGHLKNDVNRALNTQYENDKIFFNTMSELKTLLEEGKQVATIIEAPIAKSADAAIVIGSAA